MADRYPAYSTPEEAKTSIRNYILGLNERAVDLASATLKALLLLNGGAAVAMLGFVASISGHGTFDQLNLSKTISVLQLYALGAAFAGLATGISYIVMYMQAILVINQEFIDEKPYVQKGEKFVKIYRSYAAVHLLAVCIAILSFAFFLLGVWRTGSVFMGI